VSPPRLRRDRANAAAPPARQARAWGSYVTARLGSRGGCCTWWRSLYPYITHMNTQVLLESADLHTAHNDQLHTLPHTPLHRLLQPCRGHPPPSSSRHRSRLLHPSNRNAEHISRTTTASVETTAMGVRACMDDAVWLDGICGVSSVDYRDAEC